MSSFHWLGDGETEEDVVCRFKVAFGLAPDRLQYDRRLRLVMSYMLREPDWIPHDIVDIVIDRDGLVQLVGVLQVKNVVSKTVYPFSHVDFLRGEILELSRRAELGKREEEWLLTLPGVRDLREQAETGW